MLDGLISTKPDNSLKRWHTGIDWRDEHTKEGSLQRMIDRQVMEEAIEFLLYKHQASVNMSACATTNWANELSHPWSGRTRKHQSSEVFNGLLLKTTMLADTAHVRLDDDSIRTQCFGLVHDFSSHV